MSAIMEETYLVGSVNNTEFLSRGFIATNFQQIGQPLTATSSVVDLGIDLQNDDEMIAFVFNSTESGRKEESFMEYISDIPFDQLDEQIQSQNDANNGSSVIDPNSIIPLLRESSSLIRVIDGKDPTPNRSVDDPIDFKRDGAARDAFTLQEGSFIPPPITQPLIVFKQQAIIPQPIAMTIPSNIITSATPYQSTTNQMNLTPMSSRMDSIKREFNTVETPVPYPSTPQEPERIIVRTPIQPIVSTPLSNYSAQTPISMESSLDQYSENGDDSAEKKKRKKRRRKRKKRKRRKKRRNERRMRKVVAHLLKSQFL